MSLIVPQVLNNNNYKIWSACMKDYFSSQGLWDVVIDVDNNNPSSEEWKQKNGMALHAIKMSCAPVVLSHIGFAERASDAWRQLERIQKRRDKGTSSDTLEIQVGIESRCEGNGARNTLLKLVQEGKDTDQLGTELGRLIPEERVKILGEKVTRTGGTLIHAAIVSEKVEMVKFLVGKISKDEVGLLKEEDKNQFTALDTIAAHIGNRESALEMAKCITDKFPELVTHGDVLTPILIASAHAHKDMTRYLYNVIAPANDDDRPRGNAGFLVDDLNADNGRLHGTILLSQCINGKMFDIASDLLRRFPGLAGKQCGFVDPIQDLCKLPSAFSCQGLSWKESIKSYLCSGRLLRVIKCLGIVDKMFEDQKKIHSEAKIFLKSICKEISKLSPDQQKETSVREAMLEAAKNGIAEFITEMVGANNNQRHMLFFDEDRRNMFSYAVIYRREKVFNLIYGVSPKGIDDLTNIVDSYDNNMLHLAASMSESSSTFDATSGAALQMQRELQWFKEVERLCKPSCKEMLNQDGLTPRQLFTESHKKLVRDGEDWMKTTAQSSTVVVALIVTVTFASAVTVPGGNDQNNGFPMFLPYWSFKAFTVLNALSFFSSLTSVLMFLGILTSRYAEEDFLLSLPTKLIVGLASLSLSIGTMMATFCFALVLMLKGQLMIILLVVSLSCIPILIFLFSSLFPLLQEIFVSTYRPRIFDYTTRFPIHNSSQTEER